MICEHILGNLTDSQFAGHPVETVEIPWHDAFKKLHKKTTSAGTEVGIRLDDSILTRGLREGDVLGWNGSNVVAVTIPACEVIVVEAEPDHAHMMIKAAYEIGNRHAPLFWGENHCQLLTIYDPPMMEMLQKLHGISVKVECQKIDFDRRISATVHSHHH